MDTIRHIPVLPDEVLTYLRPLEGAILVDGTCGTGGHTEMLLQKGARVIAVDLDGDALKAASERLKSYIPDRLELVHGNFRDLACILEKRSIGAVDGILADLGVSSLQLDDASRGFSFRSDARLDMRMDPDSSLTAADLLKKASEAELAKILWEYGEERYSRRIARAVAARRRAQPIETTRELAELVLRATPKKGSGRWRIHPATRTFQALRIAVNGELDALSSFLDTAPQCLKPGARICVISYHSLEDRIVKRAFKALSAKASGEGPRLSVLTRRPVEPSDEEVQRNPRSRSGKLRAAERCTDEDSER
jgi:16S rRNA (cytosine1402-N4)-methyltransferase